MLTSGAAPGPFALSRYRLARLPPRRKGDGMAHLTYLQAIAIGALQGVTELFPVSSLGHSILIPALIGGSWASNLDMSATDSPYLTFLVAVHVAV